jgi:chromosome segregation ATPase
MRFCRLQALEKQLNDSLAEVDELRKQLSVESQSRTQAEEQLNEAREQVHMHQQLSARAVDQVWLIKKMMIDIRLNVVMCYVFFVFVLKSC